MTNCGLNGYLYILGIILVTLNKLIYDSQNICGCLTLNEMLIKLASLIICSTNDNLTNTTLTSPSEVKKQYCIYTVHLIILCTSTETFIYWKFKDKIFNLFQVPNQHNCCVTLLGSFFKY